MKKYTGIGMAFLIICAVNVWAGFGGSRSSGGSFSSSARSSSSFGGSRSSSSSYSASPRSSFGGLRSTSSGSSATITRPVPSVPSSSGSYSHPIIHQTVIHDSGSSNFWNYMFWSSIFNRPAQPIVVSGNQQPNQGQDFQMVQVESKHGFFYYLMVVLAIIAGGFILVLFMGAL